MLNPKRNIFLRQVNGRRFKPTYSVASVFNVAFERRFFRLKTSFNLQVVVTKDWIKVTVPDRLQPFMCGLCGQCDQSQLVYGNGTKVTLPYAKNKFAKLDEAFVLDYANSWQVLDLDNPE